jgi:Calcineurin-like phosphoesterase
MKFKLLSDLHLEFYGRQRPGLPDAPVWKPTPSDGDKDTVLLLAGDVHVGEKGKPWIEEMCDRFQHVVYILGNHEYYNHVWQDILGFWKEYQGPDNFTFLENKTLHLDNVRILGTTMWTKVDDPFARWRGQQGMSDYHVILVKGLDGKHRKLNVSDTDAVHVQAANFLKDELAKPWNGTTIVMTHHLPHPVCVHPRFKDSPLNEFFMCDMTYILENFDIDYWVHGHTHDCVDTHVGKTRILCNPMGYHGVQLNRDFNEDLVFNG